MATRQDDRIRERAYHLWQESGGEPGREMEHWLRAEQEMAETPEGAASGQAAGKGEAESPDKAAAKPVSRKPGANRAAAKPPNAAKSAAGKPERPDKPVSRPRTSRSPKTSA